jgi:hypothetical protein
MSECVVQKVRLQAMANVDSLIVFVFCVRVFFDILTGTHELKTILNDTSTRHARFFKLWTTQK